MPPHKSLRQTTKQLAPAFLLFAVLFTGCSDSDTATTSTAPTTSSPQPSPSSYPTLVVDAEHNADGSNQTPAYQLSSTEGLWLDGSHYHFTYGTNDLSPNMVQVIADHAAYKLYFPVQTNIFIVSPTTLKAIKGGLFHGFNTGDTDMVAIGHVNDSSGLEEFYVSWTGKIEVKQ